MLAHGLADNHTVKGVYDEIQGFLGLEYAFR